MPDHSARSPRRRWPWTAKLLVVILLVAGVFAGTVAVGLQRARRQREAVSRIWKQGGWAFYNCRYDESGRLEGFGPPGPKWVTRLMGADFLGTVNGVTLAGAEPLEGLPLVETLALPREINVTDDGLAALESLPELQWLALNRTPITDSGLDHVQGLSNLRRLWLANTQIGDAGLGRLRQLERLEALWLDNTLVTDAGLENLRHLVHLKSLSLSGTQVSDAGLKQFEPIVGLRTLHLNGTQCTFTGVLQLLTGSHGRSFEEALQIAGYVKSVDAGQIVSLDLSPTRLSDAGLAQIRRLPNIEWLYLNGTQVTDAGLARLDCLTELTYLHLAHTPITDAGLKHLAGLPKLRRLHLEGTAVTEQGVSDFQKRTSGRVRIYLPGREAEKPTGRGSNLGTLICVSLFCVCARFSRTNESSVVDRLTHVSARGSCASQVPQLGFFKSKFPCAG